jgi:hypothetical protein
MRWVLGMVVVLVGCTSSSEGDSTSPSSSPPSSSSSPERDESLIGPSGGGGGLPPPECSEPKSNETVGCNHLDFRREAYCSEIRFNHPMYTGQCFAPVTNGTFTAKVRGVSFTATHVGARRVGYMIEVIGLVTDGDPNGAVSAIRLLVPTEEPKTVGCGGTSLASVTLSERNGVDAWSYGPRGSCEITVASIGTEVSGTFVAAVDGGAEITEGAFAIAIGP